MAQKACPLKVEPQRMEIRSGINKCGATTASTRTLPARAGAGNGFQLDAVRDLGFLVRLFLFHQTTPSFREIARAIAPCLWNDIRQK
jgi:hypothetical protein